MGIDISCLSDAAQRQVLRKLAAAQLQKKAVAKYHNEPDTRTTGDGTEIRFSSRKEAKRYDALIMLLKAGAITDLKLQPQFTLQESYMTPEGKRVRSIRYVADFSYRLAATGELVVEDVKSKATKTRVYGMKRKMLLERTGISVVEVE